MKDQMKAAEQKMAAIAGVPVEMTGNYIGRSITTGKYHMTDSPNITFCNYSGQVRGARNRMATDVEIEKAGEHMFCKKCFPNGKPK